MSHPPQHSIWPAQEPQIDRSTSVELSLGQAYEAACRIAAEHGTNFDYEAFEHHIERLTATLLEALRSRGAKGAVWMGNDEFAFIFPEGEEGDQQAEGFRLAFR
jgi:hypothetical protein